MRELDNYVPKLAIIQNDPENFTTNIYYTYTKFKLKIFNSIFVCILILVDGFRMIPCLRVSDDYLKTMLTKKAFHA